MKGFCLKISGFSTNHGSALLTTGFSTDRKGVLRPVLFSLRHVFYQANAGKQVTST
jgi:hypothetical protein